MSTPLAFLRVYLDRWNKQFLMSILSWLSWSLSFLWSVIHLMAINVSELSSPWTACRPTVSSSYVGLIFVGPNDTFNFGREDLGWLKFLGVNFFYFVGSVSNAWRCCLKVPFTYAISFGIVHVWSWCCWCCLSSSFGCKLRSCYFTQNLGKVCLLSEYVLFSLWLLCFNECKPFPRYLA